MIYESVVVIYKEYCMTMVEHDEVREILRDLYSDIKGTLISCEERSRKKISENTFVYGEADFDSMVKIFDIVNPQPHEVFYDFGSGVGKQVLAAAMLCNCSAVYGVEYLDDLYATSCDVLEVFRKEHIPRFSSESVAAIHFDHQDFFSYDFPHKEAVLFTCSTCFDTSMMEGIARKVEELASGSRVITLTKQLPSEEFEEITNSFYPMSWGASQVFIYKRK
jgi:hypothetical protein